MLEIGVDAGHMFFFSCCSLLVDCFLFLKHKIVSIAVVIVIFCCIRPQIGNLRKQFNSFMLAMNWVVQHRSHKAL